jgi:two-component system OmpR family response regulator
MKNQNILAFLFDDIQVEPQTFQVLKAGRPVTLEPKTLKLLLFLLENRGRLIEKGEILDAVWKDTAVTDNALTRESHSVTIPKMPDTFPPCILAVTASSLRFR